MKLAKGIALFCIFLACKSFAQKKLAFGTVSPADFIVSSPVVDSNANAVIISDVGSTEFMGNNNGDFTLVFKQTKRLFIRNRKGFDAATIHIPIYMGSNFRTEEKFLNFQAATYNLENGLVAVMKMKEEDVFTEKISKTRIEKKFTFSNIKEGSIVEYTYTIKSPFYNRLRAWVFQGKYPCLWSEYRVTIPPMFNYFTSHKGYLKLTVDSANRIFKSYTISDNGSIARTEVYHISGDAVFRLWAIKDVPAFKLENYTSSSYNYFSRVSFLLHSIQYSDSRVTQIMKDWHSTAEQLMKDEEFGLVLTEPKGWLSDVKKLVANEQDRLEQAKKIYSYVQSQFTCNNHEALYLSQPLKKTFQSKTGNVSDINLMLTAIMLDNDFEAAPVVLSTRDNGWANETTALLDDYNYVLCRIKIDEVYYLLDASHSRVGFGKLPEDCYNGSGRLIDKMPVLVNLSPDSLTEGKLSMVFIVNGEKEGLEGFSTSTLGQFESYGMRERMTKMKKEDIQKEMAKGFSSDIKIDGLELDSLAQYDFPVAVKYNLKFTIDQNVIYFKPMLGEATRQNPFASAKRFYPVEMPFKQRKTYVLDMEIPKGYVVDEIPQSVRYKLNEDEGLFEYLIRKTPEKIQLRCVVSLNKATFPTEDYESLRDFYSVIIKKQSEEIVFKKIQ